MPDNNKKEYPICGDETDACSKYGRRIHIVFNRSGVAKYVKRKMNKRFRRKKRDELRELHKIL
ncbi:MAG: hypothetical protein ACLFUH_07640 [Bacteroidales bacterium]